MNRKIKKPILLLVLACVLACSFIFAACDDDDKLSGLGGSDTMAYTVTVTQGENVDVDFTSITAQWKSGGEVKASIVLDATGKAAVTLAKGNYTVSLTGNALADYDWSEQSVSEASPNATITLSAKAPVSPEAITYSVTVTCNDSELDLTTLAVQWAGSDDTQSRVLKADGTATIELDPGDYAVTVVGLTKPTYYTVTTDTVSATKTAASITITAIKRDVAVSVTSPVDLPADVKVQVKDDGEPYGEPVEISENKATVVVPFGKAVTVELVGLDAYDYIESSPVNVAATDKTAALNVSLCTVTYTVHVESTQYTGTIDDLTVTIYSGSDPVANAIDLPVQSGVASVNLLAGEYTVVLNGLNATDYKYVAEPLTITDHDATVTIVSRLVTLSQVDRDGAVTYEATTAFDSEDEVKRVAIPAGAITKEKFYSILVSSESDLFNSHNFTIVYNSETFTVGKDRHEADEVSYIVIRAAEGKNEFTLAIKDGGFFEDEIIISLQEYEEIDTVIELGEEKEIYATTTYTFAVSKDNAYLISVDADNLTDFSINIGEGIILGKDSNSKATTYEFYALEGEVTEVSVYLYASVSIKLTITETYGDIKIDEEHEVTLGGWYTYADKNATFKVPTKAIYKIEIISDTVNAGDVGVSLNGKDPLLDDDSSVKEAQFNATNGEEVYFTFYTWGQNAANATIKIKISIVKKTGNILEVGGQNTAKVSNMEKPARFVIEGAEAGKSYRIVILTPPVLGKATFYLGYADHTGENALTFTRGTGENGFSAEYVFIDFEYVAGENAIEIYSNSGAIGEITVDLKDPSKEEVKLGPGGSVTVDKVTSDHIVIMLDTSALRHGTPYVVTGNFFAMWVGNGGLKLKYGDSEVNFANAGDWENCKAEFTFVEDDFLSGPNAIEIYTDGAEWPSPVTFTLTAK